MADMDLTPTRIENLQRLFELALQVAPEDRAALLDRESGNNAALREEVLALIAAHETRSDPLNRPLLAGDRVSDDMEGSLWLGIRAGPWRVTRTIGSGGMGTVCEVERADAQFEKRAAIKFLRTRAPHASMVQRFRDERQILASLNHPNVATLLDGGVTDDGQPYLVMEYVDGEPITAWAEQHSLSIRARVRLFLQVCAAVEAAHRNLIVHRDLKPGNILVTSDGRVKLLDFGIARLLGDEAAGPISTRGSEPASFTPSYAAPEQMRALPVSTSTDVFALGAVLYRLLTGRLPFQTRADPEAVAGPAGLAPDLDAILARAMQVDREQRYSTVQELRNDLESWLDGRPVAAYRGGRAYRLGKFLRRHRVGSTIGAAAAIAILATSGVALWQWYAAQRAADNLLQYNAFLMDVLKMSDPFSEGDELTLSEALDRAAQSISERFPGRPDLSAEIRFGIGASMASRYRLDQAEAQLAQAQKESLDLFGSKDIRTLRVNESIAGLRLEQSRFAEAESGYQGVIHALESTANRTDPLYAMALGNLGNVYLQQERYAEADRTLQRARTAAAGIASLDPYERAGITSNLAHAVHGLEDYPRADQYYLEAAAAYRSLFPEGSPDLAILYNNHAMLHEDRGDMPTALAMHRESLAMRRKVFRDQHPMVVTALSNLGRLSLQAGDAAAALAYAMEGAAMADRVYTAPNRFHPSIHATLAATQLATDDLPAAQRSWSRARDLLRKLPEAPPTVVKWVDDVRGRLCKAAPKDCPAPALQTPAR
jgi:tetratricopeptide (TPR) repeat protein/predicted Ser/Thr protein kinase